MAGLPKKKEAGSIGPRNDTGGQNTLTFLLNPTEITRERIPQYAQTQAALGDYLADYGSLVPSPLEWVRNPPERIAFDLLLITGVKYSVTQRYPTGNLSTDIETELGKLDKMMLKSAQTRGPVDLIFKFGNRSDIVRITNKRVKEEEYSLDLHVIRATVHLELLTVKAGRYGR